MTSLDASESLQAMRAGILVMSFVPYLYYAIKDGKFHFRGRKVALSEHILHLCITLLMLAMFGLALRAHHAAMLAALVLFAVAGGVDEYIYHREIPAEESDLHAKGHLALLIFVILSLASDWLQANDWNFHRAFQQITGAP